jgi:hypothetical protein
MSLQLVVFMENRPGALSELAHVLADAGVNITGMLLEGSVDFGACRIHTNNPRQAMKALEDAGYQVEAGKALVLRMEDKPGKLAEISDKLHDAKINVTSVFGTTNPKNGEAEFVFMVDDPERAEEILGLKKND